METFVISFVVMAIVVLAMAVGVMVHGRALKGSCGGLNAIEGLEGSCALCADQNRCRNKERATGRCRAPANRSVS